MKSTTKKSSPLILKYIGEDFWSRPVYQDQFSRLWKDIELGDSEIPSLYSVTNNEFDGEPLAPIKKDFIFQGPRNPNNHPKKFQYQMLGRLQSDCEYYLGYGNKSPDILWANSEKEQIKAMKNIWLSFSEEEKPAWLTWDQILEYEKAMCEIR